MSCFEMVEAVLRMGMSKLGASSDSYGDIFKRSLEVVTRMCPRNEFEAKSAKTFEIQTQAGCSKFKNICAGAFEDAWKLERSGALHVLNVAESYREDRYGRSSKIGRAHV